MRRVCILPVLLATAAFAQQQHAHFTVQADPAIVPPGGKSLARVNVTIDSGWHLYSSRSPSRSPPPTSFDSCSRRPNAPSIPW